MLFLTGSTCSSQTRTNIFLFILWAMRSWHHPQNQARTPDCWAVMHTHTHTHTHPHTHTHNCSHTHTPPQTSTHTRTHTHTHTHTCSHTPLSLSLFPHFPSPFSSCPSSLTPLLSATPSPLGSRAQTACPWRGQDTVQG